MPVTMALTWLEKTSLLRLTRSSIVPPEFAMSCSRVEIGRSSSSSTSLSGLPLSSSAAFSSAFIVKVSGDEETVIFWIDHLFVFRADLEEALGAGKGTTRAGYPLGSRSAADDDCAPLLCSTHAACRSITCLLPPFAAPWERTALANALESCGRAMFKGSASE